MFASVRACNTRDVYVHVQSLGTDVNLITAKLVCVCVCVCVRCIICAGRQFCTSGRYADQQKMKLFLNDNINML